MKKGLARFVDAVGEAFQLTVDILHHSPSDIRGAVEVEQMRSTNKTFVIGTVAAVLILISVALISAVGNRRSLLKGYNQLQPGDSKERVVQLLGEPSSKHRCNAGSQNTLSAECVEQYWYVSFLERHILLFDKDGKLIKKAYNVSF